ncbi:hypothetical protein L7F22_010124 [Adiantum nelumboides]|nr:hypothetical protein [Adiantum nelumboides]
MLRGLYSQVRSRRPPFCTEQFLTYRCLQYEAAISIGAICNYSCKSRPSTRGHNVFETCSSIDPSTQKIGYYLHSSNVLSLGEAARTYSSFSNFKVPSSRSKDETSQNDGSVQPENREKMVEDANALSVARELRQARQDMIVNMRRCSYVLFAVGAVHAVWGSAMFLSLQETLNHAVMTEVCMSSLVLGALAYQLRQAVKPIQLFANLKEDGYEGTVFLSRQVTRLVAAFFHRGHGIAFVLSLPLGAHALSCIRFLF